MVAIAAGNKVFKVFGGGLEELQVEDEGEIQHHGTNKYIPLVSCISNLFSSWHCLFKSLSILHGYLLSTYTGVESGFSRLWYGVRVVQTTLQALFWSTITGVVVQSRVLEALLCQLLTRVIWLSHADLSSSGPHKLVVPPFPHKPIALS